MKRFTRLKNLWNRSLPENIYYKNNIICVIDISSSKINKIFDLTETT